MKMMFSCCTDQDEVKQYVTKIMNKRNDKHVTKIVEIEEQLNPTLERDLEPQLSKWRLKERNQEFAEKINLLTIKELLPKA
jgi:uncharacterized membrane protein YheB (UPF0754 family)